MAATGVNVKALDSMPELTSVDSFYLDMYKACNTDFSRICTYCSLYSFSNDEILEALDLMQTISERV